VKGEGWKVEGGGWWELERGEERRGERRGGRRVGRDKHSETLMPIGGTKASGHYLQPSTWFSRKFFQKQKSLQFQNILHECASDLFC
jgi:hypothetical protein